jgi:hypothetical protein
MKDVSGIADAGRMRSLEDDVLDGDETRGCEERWKEAEEAGRSLKDMIAVGLSLKPRCQ